MIIEEVLRVVGGFEGFVFRREKVGFSFLGILMREIWVVLVKAGVFVDLEVFL